MAYADFEGKVILHSWGRFRATVTAATKVGDLLNFAGALADGNSTTPGLNATCVACQDGAAADEIWVALAAEIGKRATIATGGVATEGTHGGAIDTVLYLSDTAGKLSESAGTVIAQPCGLCVSTTKVMVMPGCPSVFILPAATLAAAPAGGTGATAGAYDSAANRDIMIAAVNGMLTALKNLGIIAKA